MAALSTAPRPHKKALTLLFVSPGPLRTRALDSLSDAADDVPHP